MEFETFRDVDASDAPTRRGGFVLRKRVIVMKDEGVIVDKTRMFDGWFLTRRVKRRCKRMLRNYNRAMDGIHSV